MQEVECSIDRVIESRMQGLQFGHRGLDGRIKDGGSMFLCICTRDRVQAGMILPL